MDEWIALYKSGLSAMKIAKQYSTYPQKVRRYLKKHEVNCRTTSEAASSLPANEIIREYNFGVSARQLAKKYNSTITSITDLLRRFGIEPRQPNPTHANWEFINERGDFFWYWLGWMLSDGCVCYKRAGGRSRGVITQLSVHKDDRCIVEFFKSKINPEVIIHNGKNYSAIGISIPRECADGLADYGLVPRKSNILDATDRLRAVDNRSFHQMLVGYIEGDGHIDNRGGCCITCGSEKWLVYLQNRVGGSITRHDAKRDTAYRLRISSSSTSLLYKNWIDIGIQYMMLRRKWDKIREVGRHSAVSPGAVVRHDNTK